jgi:hypothetical protein
MQFQVQNQNNPMSQLGQSFEQIIKSAQIAATDLDPATAAQDWQAVGQAMNAVQQQEMQFVQNIQSAIQSANQTFGAMINNFKLAGMVDSSGKPDYAAQVAYLKKQADLTYNAIATAPDAATVQQLQAQLVQYINQIAQIGGQEGPGASQAFAKWGEQVSEEAQQAIIARLRALGAQMDTANQAFLAKFQPIWDAYSKQVQQSGTDMNNFGGAVSDTTTKMNDLGDSAEALSKKFTAMADNSDTSAWVTNTQSRVHGAGSH